MSHPDRFITSGLSKPGPPWKKMSHGRFRALSMCSMATTCLANTLMQRFAAVAVVSNEAALAGTSFAKDFLPAPYSY